MCRLLPKPEDACGLISPDVNTGVMNAFLEQFSRELPADVHAVMVLDRAGWHTARGLCVPGNITLVHLPPKSPELNPKWRTCRHYSPQSLLVQPAVTRRGTI